MSFVAVVVALGRRRLLMEQSSAQAAASTYTQASMYYLDTVTAQDAAQRLKQKSYALLAARAGDALLDAGCGTGDDVRALARLVGPTGRVIGIDFREDVIAEAQRRSATDTNTTFEVADIYQLPFAEATFDGCRAERVFIHLLDPRQALTELIRVTRPGGQIVVMDPDWDTLAIATPDVAISRTLTHLICDNTRQGQMGRQLYGLFQAAGLQEVTILADTVVLTDFAVAAEIFHLRTLVELAQQQELLTAETAASWLASLEGADRAGQFFSAITGFMASGRKP
ncbi:MAG: methyltransferase domain-containing protein [Thermomicrobiales bacterium]